MIFCLAALAAAISLAAIPPTRGAEHQVVVGGPNILQFNPSSLTADPGDLVTFVFKQKNHTATQSTFAIPCAQAEGGFDSGFVPVADNVTDGPFPTAQFTVKDTNPVWVYCRQAGHCQQGMVFSINPGDKFAAFQANAMGNSTSQSSAAPSSTLPASSSPPATSPASSSTPSSVAKSTDHKVIVGGPNTFTYQPANITAQPGDTVTFEFHQKNHTVTQSSFAAPCRKLSDTSTSGQVSFNSGYMPVADNATTFPTYTIQVNDTAPIWAYCAQPGHCGMGMVFSVNAVESGSNTFEAYQARAKQLNGTDTTSGSNTPSGAASLNRGQGIAVALGSVVVWLLL